MKQVTFDNMKVIVNLEDGETITSGKPLSGKLIVGEEAKEGVFTKNPKKEKVSTKNPAHFTGEYMTLRLNKDSQFRLTMLLAYDTKVSEIRSQLCSEFNKMLDSMPH